MSHMPEAAAPVPYELTTKGEVYAKLMQIRRLLTALDPTDRREVLDEIKLMTAALDPAAQGDSMYSWTTTTNEQWLTLTDVYGNRHVFPVSRVVQIYDAPRTHQPSFAQETVRDTYIELDNEVEIMATESVDRLAKLIFGDRSSSENG